MGSTGFLVAANILGAIAVMFSIVAFATDHWVDIEVNRSQLPETEQTLSMTSQDLGRIAYSRWRGLMRECYNNDAQFLALSGDNVDGNCFYIDFDDMPGGGSDNYMHRMHMQRAIVGIYIIGMVTMILTFCLGIFLCFSKRVVVAAAAAILVLFGSVCLLITVVLFHTVEYFENNEDGDTGELSFQNVWSRELRKFTVSELDYSYALAWVAIILGTFVGIIYLLAARSIRQANEEDNSSDRESVIKKSKRNSEADYYAYDNHASVMGMPMYNPSMVAAYPPDMAAMAQTYQIPYGNTVYALPAPVSAAALSRSSSFGKH